MLTSRIWGLGRRGCLEQDRMGYSRSRPFVFGRKCQAINTELVLQWQLQLAKMRFFFLGFLAATHNANMDICGCYCYSHCSCCCCCLCQLPEFRNRNKVALNALGAAAAIANCIYILHRNLHLVSYVFFCVSFSSFGSCLQMFCSNTFGMVFIYPIGFRVFRHLKANGDFCRHLPTTL